MTLSELLLITLSRVGVKKRLMSPLGGGSGSFTVAAVSVQFNMSTSLCYLLRNLYRNYIFKGKNVFVCLYVQLL